MRPVPERDNVYFVFIAGPGNFDNRRMTTDIDYMNEALRIISKNPIVVTKIRTAAEWR